MIIKHGRHIVGEICEMRKGIWASGLCYSYADWLRRQTAITWWFLG